MRNRSAKSQIPGCSTILFDFLSFPFRSERRWIAVVCVALISAVGCATEANRLSTDEVFEITYNELWQELPERIVSDSKATFLRTDNITALLLAGGGSIAMHNTNADNDIAKRVDERVFNHWSEETLYCLGGPSAHFAATGLWYMLSVKEQDQLNRDRAWTMLSALSVTTLTTGGLKAIVHNDTPNGQKWAWPSGHTASSFTVASVLDEYYGPSVGIPAYAFASLVGLRMMDTGDHWASDVVFGATLGWVVGHTIAGKHKQAQIAGFAVAPYIEERQNGTLFGVNLFKRF